MIHKSHLHESSGFEKKKKGKEPQDPLRCLQALLTSPVSQEKPIKTHVIDERFMIELNGGGFGKISESKVSCQRGEKS